MCAANQIPGYEQVDQALVDAHAAMGAAECHGVLCGMICAQPRSESAPWLREVLGTSRDWNPAQRRAATLLEQLLAATLQQLYGEQFVFEPFLPVGEEPFVLRVEALAHWCRGFYFGLTLGGVKDLAGLPDNSREFVRDVLEITKAAKEAGPPSEEEEKSFTELVEYLRVGVMLVREELHGK